MYGKKDNYRIKKSAKDWKQRLHNLENGKSSKLNDYEISVDKEKEIFGKDWYEIFNWYKFHPKEPVKNLLLITAKSARKTTLIKFKTIIELSRNKFLDALETRNTADLAMVSGKKQVFKSLNFLADEYGCPMPREIASSFASGVYMVVDKSSKDNQVLEFNSFEGLIRQGGFTNKYLIHFEEMIDPNNSSRILSIKDKITLRKRFIADLKFISMKNVDNFVSSGIDYKQLGALNYISLNRYDKNEPVIEFAEKYSPWKPVRDWFLSDLINNTIYVKYVDKVDKEWRGLEKTLIVYATKFSNQLLTRNEDWLAEQLEIMDDPTPEDVAILVGDLYEGYADNRLLTYQRNSIPILDKPVGEYVGLSVGIDIDVNEEIVITPIYLMKVQDKKVLETYGKPIYYTLKMPQIILTISEKLNTLFYRKWLKEKINYLFLSKECNTFYVYIDDNQKFIKDQLQLDTENKFNIFLAKKHGDWGILERTKFMITAIGNGFAATVKGNERLNNDYLNCVNERTGNDKKKIKRDERKGKNSLNLINSDEYAIYPWRNFLKSFPHNFWNTYFSKN